MAPGSRQYAFRFAHSPKGAQITSSVPSQINPIDTKFRRRISLTRDIYQERRQISTNSSIPVELRPANSNQLIVPHWRFARRRHRHWVELHVIVRGKQQFSPWESWRLGLGQARGQLLSRGSQRTDNGRSGY